jgi:hypothetical protein
VKAMTDLAFSYTAPAGAMSSLRVTAGRLGETDKANIRQMIDRDWANLSTMERGKRTFDIDGTPTEFSFESRPDPENPRDPLMEFTAVHRRPARSRASDGQEDIPVPGFSSVPLDDGALGDIVLRFVIDQQQKIIDPKRLPADLLTLVGCIVVLMAREEEENRVALVSAVRALGKRYPDLAGIAPLLGASAQNAGGGWGLSLARRFAAFRRER